MKQPITRTIALVLCVALGAVAAAPPTADAHETDQFTVPAGQEMADLGPYLNGLFVEHLEDAVARVNDRIRQAVENPKSLRTRASGHGKASRPRPSQQIDPQAVLDACQSPEGIAEAMWVTFGSAVDLIELLEDTVQSDAFQARYPGKVVAHNAADRGESVYTGLYFVLDPRTAFRLFHASTIKAYGVYLGTDKIGHFTDMGYHYFKAYRNAVRDGHDEASAMREAVKLGTDGVFSEKAALGYATAGAYSNADLVSNYVGCLFYRNLTEPVVIKGVEREPMLVRDGPYWKVADHVKADDRFFERFVSDHYDEVLNPSHFERIIQPTLRKKVEERVPSLLAWYRPRYGSQEPRPYFELLAKTLSTYYGQPYGHSGQWDELIGLWNTGRDALAQTE